MLIFLLVVIGICVLITPSSTVLNFSEIYLDVNNYLSIKQRAHRNFVLQISSLCLLCNYRVWNMRFQLFAAKMLKPECRECMQLSIIWNISSLNSQLTFNVTSHVVNSVTDNLKTELNQSLRIFIIYRLQYSWKLEFCL